MAELIRGVPNSVPGLLVCLCLGACSQPLSSGELYLQRIGDALDRPLAVEPVEFAPYPQRRTLLQPIPALDISVAEFARLHACDMGGLVGERNGSLARLARDSQRLLYELTWLAAAQNCIDQGQDWLTPLRQQKVAALPDLFWNATFASAEMSQAMSLGGAAARHSDQADEQLRMLADLIERGLQQQREPLDRDLENTLHQLTLTTRIGERRKYWAILRHQMKAASDALNQREPAVCLSGQQNNRSRRLLAVFQRYYVDLWQAEFTQLLAADKRWLTAMARSIDLLQAAAPEEFLSWYNAALNSRQANSEWQRTRQAVADHVQAWQGLFEQCGIDVATLRGTA